MGRKPKEPEIHPIRLIESCPLCGELFFDTNSSALNIEFENGKEIELKICQNCASAGPGEAKERVRRHITMMRFNAEYLEKQILPGIAAIPVQEWNKR